MFEHRELRPPYEVRSSYEDLLMRSASSIGTLMLMYATPRVTSSKLRTSTRVHDRRVDAASDRRRTLRSLGLHME